MKQLVYFVVASLISLLSHGFYCDLVHASGVSLDEKFERYSELAEELYVLKENQVESDANVIAQVKEIISLDKELFENSENRGKSKYSAIKFLSRIAKVRAKLVMSNSWEPIAKLEKILSGQSPQSDEVSDLAIAYYYQWLPWRAKKLFDKYPPPVSEANDILDSTVKWLALTEAETKVVWPDGKLSTFNDIDYRLSQLLGVPGTDIGREKNPFSSGSPKFSYKSKIADYLAANLPAATTRYTLASALHDELKSEKPLEEGVEVFVDDMDQISISERNYNFLFKKINALPQFSSKDDKVGEIRRWLVRKGYIREILKDYETKLEQDEPIDLGEINTHSASVFDFGDDVLIDMNVTYEGTRANPGNLHLGDPTLNIILPKNEKKIYYMFNRGGGTTIFDDLDNDGKIEVIKTGSQTTSGNMNIEIANLSTHQQTELMTAYHGGVAEPIDVRGDGTHQLKISAGDGNRIGDGSNRSNLAYDVSVLSYDSKDKTFRTEFETRTTDLPIRSNSATCGTKVNLVGYEPLAHNKVVAEIVLDLKEQSKDQTLEHDQATRDTYAYESFVQARLEIERLSNWRYENKAFEVLIDINSAMLKNAEFARQVNINAVVGFLVHDFFDNLVRCERYDEVLFFLDSKFIIDLTLLADQLDKGEGFSSSDVIAMKVRAGFGLDRPELVSDALKQQSEKRTNIAWTTDMLWYLVKSGDLSRVTQIMQEMDRATTSKDSENDPDNFFDAIFVGDAGPDILKVFIGIGNRDDQEAVDLLTKSIVHARIYSESETVAQGLYVAGMLALSRKNYALAKELFQSSVAEGSADWWRRNSGDVLLGLGDALLGQGSRISATTAWKMGVQLSSKDRRRLRALLLGRLADVSQGNDRLVSYSNAYQAALDYRSRLPSEAGKLQFVGELSRLFDNLMSGVIVSKMDAAHALELLESWRLQVFLDVYSGVRGEGGCAAGDADCLVKRVKAAIGVNGAFVSFYMNDKEGFAFVVDDAGARMVPLNINKSDAAKLSKDMRDQFDVKLHKQSIEQDRISATLKQVLEHGYETLILPLGIENRSNIIIVPDSTLFNIPWSALSKPTSGYADYVLQTIGYPQLSPIGDHVSIKIAPSANVLQPPSQISSPNAFLFGSGNAFNESTMKHSGYNWPVDLVLRPLTNVGFEICTASKLFESMKYDVSLYGSGLGNTCQPAKEMKRALEIQSSLGNANIVHLATHALFNVDDPLSSSLLLSNEPDGVLKASDLFKWNLSQVKLVVLSACDSGLASVKVGNEIFGFHRALFASGAKNLIMAEWSIDDFSTATYFEAFYGKLLEDGSPQVASVTAVKSMHAKKRHPYYWAGFTLYAIH